MTKPVLPYTNNKGADQPAHLCSLISAFVIRCLYSMIPLVSISEISSLYLVSVAAQAGLCLTWSQTPKTGFLVTRLKCKIQHHIMDRNRVWRFPEGSGRQGKVKSSCLIQSHLWCPDDHHG